MLTQRINWIIKVSFVTVAMVALVLFLILCNLEEHTDRSWRILCFLQREEDLDLLSEYERKIAVRFDGYKEETHTYQLQKGELDWGRKLVTERMAKKGWYSSRLLRLNQDQWFEKFESSDPDSTVSVGLIKTKYGLVCEVTVLK